MNSTFSFSSILAMASRLFSLAFSINSSFESTESIFFI